jgi:hypothetical protein
MSKTGKPVNVMRTQNGWTKRHRTWKVMRAGCAHRAYTEGFSPGSSGCILASTENSSQAIPIGRHQVIDLVLADQLSDSELAELKREGVCLTEVEITRGDGETEALKPVCSLFCRTGKQQGGDKVLDHILQARQQKERDTAWVALSRRIAERGWRVGAQHGYDPHRAGCDSAI